MNRIEVGQIYYKVSFADTSLKIPCVEPMLYLRENIFPEHEEEGVTSYYFRYPDEIAQNIASEGESEVEYYRCTEKGLSYFHTLTEAIAKLALVAAGVDLTRQPGSRGLNL